MCRIRFWKSRYAAGARLDRLLALAPLTGAAVNVALFSYLDDLHIGINMDPAAVTEPDRLMAALRAGWDDVLALAPPARTRSKDGASRRTSGSRTTTAGKAGRKAAG